MRALWLFLHELGAVRDPSEAALSAYVKRIASVDDVQWMRGGRRVETVIESLKKWAMRYLPAAVATLKEEVRDRYHKGLMSEAQTGCAARGFERSTQGDGFDVQWEAWENLRTAAGRPFPT